MARSSLSLARYIIYLLYKHNFEVSNTKVQKILYCYVGFGLAKKIPKKEIIDELPQAWDRGPVFPKVFALLKGYKNLKTMGMDMKDELSKLENEIIKKTVMLLGGFGAGHLSTWTHLPNSPWDIVYNLQKAKYAIIPLEIIKEYFEEEVEDLDANFR